MPPRQSDPDTAALRALASDYEHLNWALFGAQLRPAPLSLADGAGRLGAWSSDPRGIALSRSLVRHATWGAVLEVLKHEMAHQFVDEVMGVHDESAHGPAFRRACLERGIDARAAGLPETPAAEPGSHAILQRVQKLLALADSPNQHEAESAMRAAHRLMLRHNLDVAAAKAGHDDDYGFRHLGKPTGRSSEAERVLSGLLGEFFFVQPIWVSVFRMEDQKRVNVLEITGRRENLAMAEYVYDFLLRASESLWQQHKRARGIRSNGDRQAYRAGVMRGFADKLRAERAVQKGTGLVWVGDPLAERHFRRRHPRVRTTRAGSSERSAAADHGRRAGRDLVLHKPLATHTQSRGRLLPS